MEEFEEMGQKPPISTLLNICRIRCNAGWSPDIRPHTHHWIVWYFTGRIVDNILRCQHLLEMLPKRVQAIITRNGGHVVYWLHINARCSTFGGCLVINGNILYPFAALGTAMLFIKKQRINHFLICNPIFIWIYPTRKRCFMFISLIIFPL